MQKVAIIAISALALVAGHLEEDGSRRLRYGLRPSPDDEVSSNTDVEAKMEEAMGVMSILDAPAEIPPLRPKPDFIRNLGEDEIRVDWPMPEIRPSDPDVETGKAKVARETGVKASFVVAVEPGEPTVSSIKPAA